MKATANYVEINGNQVLDVTPDYNRPLALVDLSVLNMLTQLLPKADFGQLRHNFRTEIMNTNNLEELVQAAEDFIAFHRSVNLIREICQQDVNQVKEDEFPRVVGKIELDEL
jgi:hypothetical protein